MLLPGIKVSPCNPHFAHRSCHCRKIAPLQRVDPTHGFVSYIDIYLVEVKRSRYLRDNALQGKFIHRFC